MALSLKKNDFKTDFSFEILDKKYKKWELFFILPTLVCIILTASIGGLVTVFTLGRFLEVNHFDINSCSYHLRGNLLNLFAAGSIIGISFIYFPWNYFLKLFFKESYNEYDYYQNLKYRLNDKKAFLFISKLLMTIGVIGVLLFFDYSIEINPKKIILNDFFSITNKTYKYTEIKSINFVRKVKSKKGESYDSPHYYVTFVDNNYWSTQTGINDTLLHDDIFLFLSKKSNLKIDTIQYDP